ncbi:hypothetical protein AAY473_027459 [Plecturocebus cupreus]
MSVILALWEAKAGKLLEFRNRLANMIKPHCYKNRKISQAWWWVPVIPATWKPEPGESLEPGRQNLLTLGESKRVELLTLALPPLGLLSQGSGFQSAFPGT